ncbi:MAG: hypothetical protein ACFE9S_12345 [Candidatus Hermodarchaeota archaeon]
MDSKLFKKTFPYICNNCNEFAHTLHAFCDKCGEKALRRAVNKDYKGHK